jgi:glycosyltransferase involved in cell wall biosynthesis
MKTDRITAVILCYNEAINIRHCLESVAGFCDIRVVDSFSTDDTLAICQEFTRGIVQHEYENHARQWQWALSNLDISTEWVLALDADFIVSEALKSRILADLESVGQGIAGIYVRHLYQFGGSLIRFGGTKQHWLRIVRRGRASADTSDLVDFRFCVEGETLQWREHVMEYNRHDDDISVWSLKQDKFSVRLAVEEELRRRKLLSWRVNPDLLGNPDSRFAWLRDFWLRLPLFLRPVLYFIYRYFLAFGFLDGRGGFLYHVLQGFWLRLVVDWKTAQLRELRWSNDQLESFASFMLTHRGGSVRDLVQAWQEYQ